MNLLQICLFPLAFLLGSIPFAVIIGRLGGVDVLTQGSKNPGASNVYRLAGPVYGICVFATDIGKGAFPAFLGSYMATHFGDAGMPANVLSIWMQLGAGFCAALGHIFSPFLKFKGGKGVATFLGVFMYVFPPGVLLTGIVAGTVILITRYFSAGSICGAIVLPISYFIFKTPYFSDENWPILLVTLIASFLLLFLHRGNIVRLMRGTEHKTRSNV